MRDVNLFCYNKKQIEFFNELYDIYLIQPYQITPLMSKPQFFGWAIKQGFAKTYKEMNYDKQLYKLIEI